MPTDAALESEWQTRKLRIDHALADAGWSVQPFLEGTPLSANDCAALEEYATANGPGDHALAADGDVLGIVVTLCMSFEQMSPAA